MISQIENFLNVYFKNRRYFACIYGSYANGKKNEDSDIDVIIVTSKYTKSDLENLKKFILKLHKENGLKIDNEVPLDNKLVITYSDFKNAVNLDAFPIVRGKYNVSKVIKSKKFLSSRNVKLRLAFNAITSPHMVFGNDKITYYKYKTKAEKNLIRLAISIQDSSYFSKSDLLNVLMQGVMGESGEMYLGYKNYPSVIHKLQKIIDMGVK